MLMPARGFLAPSQREKLQAALKESDCPRFTQRILILLLLNDGKTHQEISAFLGCSYRTVAYWCVHGDPEKLDTLQDRREQGNYRKATDEYIKRLMETIETSPKDEGYEFGRWTTARLATYLAQTTGIVLSGEQVRRILHQKKYAYLWAKYTLEDKQDPTLRVAFKEKLEGYLESSKAHPQKVQVWFWDAKWVQFKGDSSKNLGSKGSASETYGSKKFRAGQCDGRYPIS